MEGQVPVRKVTTCARVAGPQRHQIPRGHFNRSLPSYLCRAKILHAASRDLLWAIGRPGGISLEPTDNRPRGQAITPSRRVAQSLAVGSDSDAKRRSDPIRTIAPSAPTFVKSDFSRERADWTHPVRLWDEPRPLVSGVQADLRRAVRAVRAVRTVRRHASVRTLRTWRGSHYAQ